MKRVLVAFVVLAGLMALPSMAGAASWKGTVVAKDAKRKAVVTVSANGTAKTVRGANAGKLRIGQKVAVRARALNDGTFRAQRVKVLGRTGKARVRAVVVRSERSRVLLSAGGSVFAVKSKAARRLSTTRNRLSPGDRVLAHVKVKGGKLVAKWFKETGYADLVELEGIYLSTNEGVLELAVVHRGRVEVVVPEDLSVPELSPGDEIELLARVGEDGSFMLVALKHGHDHGHHHGVDYDDYDKVRVYGTLSELSEMTVSVKPGEDASPVSCANPAGVVLPGFAVGMEVKLECKLGENGELVLYKLKFENDVAELKAKLKHGYDRVAYAAQEYSDEEPAQHARVVYEAEGILASLEPPTISLGEGLAPFSCSKHEETAIEVLTYGEEAELSHQPPEIGQKAEMTCILDGSVLVLVELETEHDEYGDDEHHEQKDEHHEHDED